MGFFWKAFLKSQGGDPLLLLLVDGEVTGWDHRMINPQVLRGWELCAHGHQVVNFFHVVGVLSSVKQLRKCTSDTIIWVLQRGATSEATGEGSVPGKAP